MPEVAPDAGLSPMRVQLGWFTFLLAVAFVTCLLATLTFKAWLHVSDTRAIVAFFAFGIPTMVAGGATGRLWQGQQSLQTVLGWASTMVGIVCGLAILVLVASWVFSDRGAVSTGPFIGRALGFGTCGLVCGGFGIRTLFRAEGKKS